jgi:hypothetical protein
VIALVASGELYLCYVGHSMGYSWEFYWVGRFYNVRSGGFNMWGERLGRRSVFCNGSYGVS